MCHTEQQKAQSKQRQTEATGQRVSNRSARADITEAAATDPERCDGGTDRRGNVCEIPHVRLQFHLLGE